MKLKCSKCGKELEVADGVAGERHICPGCSAALVVPEAPAAAGSRCPSCGAALAPKAVFCTKCGCDLKTGIAVQTEVTAQPVSAAEFALKSTRSMRSASRGGGGLVRHLLTLLVLAGLGYGGYRGYLHYRTKRYGVTDATPLGTFAALDSHLQNVKLKRAPTPEKTAPGFGASAKAYRYVDEGMVKKSRGWEEEVVVTVGPGGEVLGVGGRHIRVPDASLPAHWSKVTRFLRTYWREVGCGEAEFEGATVGGGVFSEEPEIARFGSPRLGAIWIKLPQPSWYEIMRVSRADLDLPDILDLDAWKGPGGAAVVDPRTAEAAGAWVLYGRRPKPKGPPKLTEHDLKVLESRETGTASLAEAVTHAAALTGAHRKVFVLRLVAAEEKLVAAARASTVAKTTAAIADAKKKLSLPPERMQLVYDGATIETIRAALEGRLADLRARLETETKAQAERTDALKALKEKFAGEMK